MTSRYKLVPGTGGGSSSSGVHARPHAQTIQSIAFARRDYCTPAIRGEVSLLRKNFIKLESMALLCSLPNSMSVWQVMNSGHVWCLVLSVVYCQPSLGQYFPVVWIHQLGMCFVQENDLSVFIDQALAYHGIVVLFTKFHVRLTGDEHWPCLMSCTFGRVLSAFLGSIFSSRVDPTAWGVFRPGKCSECFHRPSSCWKPFAYWSWQCILLGSSKHWVWKGSFFRCYALL